MLERTLPQTEMKQLTRDMEAIFRQVVKIDSFDIVAPRTLATVEMFAKYVLFSVWTRLLFLFILNKKIHLIVWKLLTFSENPKGAHAFLSKSIELIPVIYEKELPRLVRERLVATISIERNVTTNGALRILQFIWCKELM